MDLSEMGKRARAAASVLAQTSSEQKNHALLALAHMLRERKEEILAANGLDEETSRQAGLPPVVLERLHLSSSVLERSAASIERVVELPDPVGEVFDQHQQSTGLRTSKRRIPLGVVGVIYEARATVTIDAAMLCLKSGNAVILRGGKETQASNAALITVIQDALRSADAPVDAVQLITDPARASVKQLLQMDQYIDVLIPRGGVSLMRFCREHARVPLLLSGMGVCHLYIDQDNEHVFTIAQAVALVHNAKVQFPGGCNSIETLLLHRDRAAAVLPAIANDLLEYGVELRVDEAAFTLLHEAYPTKERIVPAQPSDFGTEFLSLILAIRIVDSVDEAIEHIGHYGSGHSDAILTSNAANVEKFVQRVDSSAVFVNASTRFNDAEHMGMGAEIAISNQKLHARGPISLRELTSYKWVVQGNGHIRLS